MKIMGDVEGVKFVNKHSTSPTIFNIQLKGLKLDVRITATAGLNTYNSWESSSTAKWTKMVTPAGYNSSLELSGFTGTQSIVTFRTSRMTPAEYTPARLLGHSVAASITVKFYSE